MPFSFNKTEIEGLLIIEPHMSSDNRGSYKKHFEKYIFKKNGVSSDFIESSDIYSHKGVIRGLHYQTEDSQAKLVRVITGAIYDVAVDLRKGSKTFGKWHGELLRAKDNKSYYIPSGFAHGFLALEEGTIFSYQCSGKYIPSACGGIIWNDKSLNISWPVNLVNRIILSEKDQNLQTLEEYCIVQGIFK